MYSLLAILRKYDYLLEYEEEHLLDKIITKHIGDFQGLSTELRRIQRDHDFLMRNIPDRMNVGFFQMNIQPVKSQLLANAKTILKTVMSSMKEELDQVLQENEVKHNAIIEKLKTEPADI